MDSQLPDEVRLFIVESLAGYETPSITSRTVLDRFGIKINRQTIESVRSNQRVRQTLGQALENTLLCALSWPRSDIRKRRQAHPGNFPLTGVKNNVRKSTTRTADAASGVARLAARKGHNARQSCERCGQQSNPVQPPLFEPWPRCHQLRLPGDLPYSVQAGQPMLHSAKLLTRSRRRERKGYWRSI